MFSLAPCILVKKTKTFGYRERPLFVVFLLHVGSDLRILVHSLKVTIYQLIRLEDVPGDSIKNPSIDPTQQSPDSEVSDGHLVTDVES